MGRSVWADNRSRFRALGFDLRTPGEDEGEKHSECCERGGDDGDWESEEAGREVSDMPDQARLRAGLNPERENEVLEAWHARHDGG